ncbi:MAG: ABC transporter permease [Acidobacteriota bacterium]
MSGFSPRVAVGFFRRTWRRVLRRPVHLTFSLVQPLMWMAFFGFLFQRFPISEGLDYRTFLVPGLCAMTVLFGASQSGIDWIRDDQSRMLERMLAMPSPATHLLFGKLAADTSRFLLQALAVFALGLAVGAGPFRPSAFGLLNGGLALGLFGFAFAGVSSTVALWTRNQQSMATFVHLINMPMLFTSTALVPEREMPGWLVEISVWNPLSLTVNALRPSLLAARGFDFLALGVLAALAVVAFLTALGALERIRAS